MAVGESTTEGRRKRQRLTRAANPHVSFLVETCEVGKTAKPDTNVFLLSRGGEVVAVRVGVKVFQDVRHVISCFMEDNIVKKSSVRVGPGFHWSTENGIGCA